MYCKEAVIHFSDPYNLNSRLVVLCWEVVQWLWVSISVVALDSCLGLVRREYFYDLYKVVGVAH